MDTLLEILKKNLPDGVTLKNEKETTNRFKYVFCLGTRSVSGEIGKAVAPGYEKSFVTRVIATHMVQLHLSAGEVEQAQYWLKISQRAATPPPDNLN